MYYIDIFLPIKHGTEGPNTNSPRHLNPVLIWPEIQHLSQINRIQV